MPCVAMTRVVCCCATSLPRSGSAMSGPCRVAASTSAKRPDVAVLRELTEETGYVGELEDLVGVTDRVFHEVDGADRLHAIRILYRVRLTGGELRDEPKGSTDTCRWFTIRGAQAPSRRAGTLRARPRARRAGELSHPEPMHSEIAIRIAAPPELVFALARDVERWADLLPHYSRSAAVERRPDGSVVVRLHRPPAAHRGPRPRAAGDVALSDVVGARDRAGCASCTSPARRGGWT